MKAIGICLLGVVAAVWITKDVSAQNNGTAPSQEIYTHDGGWSPGFLESIFIPPMSNAPFTCILHTEWVRSLPEGGTITLVNQRRIARQSSGRFYQERWLLVPKNSSQESRITHTQIADPQMHTLYNCVPDTKVCTVTTYGGRTSTVYKPAARPSGPLANGAGYVTNEALGTDIKEGVETIGTRITENINAWVIGNDRPFTNVREFWFAPSLGINLLSKVSRPNIGSQTFTVTDLVLGEPDPQLFEVPNGFQVQDRRTAPPVQ